MTSPDRTNNCLQAPVTEAGRGGERGQWGLADSTEGATKASWS